MQHWHETVCASSLPASSGDRRCDSCCFGFREARPHTGIAFALRVPPFGVVVVADVAALQWMPPFAAFVRHVRGAGITHAGLPEVVSHNLRGQGSEKAIAGFAEIMPP